MTMPGTTSLSLEITRPIAENRIPGYEADREFRPVLNPARPAETVGYVALGTSDDVDRAVNAAALALPGWAAFSPASRAEILEHASARLRDVSAMDLTELLTREHGKVLWESKLDIDAAPTVLEYYASLADQFAEVRSQPTRAGSAILRRVPIGVSAVIVPWNYPVHLAFLMLVPALLAGNTVIVKPPEAVPLTLTKILNTVADLLPEGVLTLVQGEGKTVGAALAKHRGVSALYFTGSTATGKQIMIDSAGTLKRLGLELGGNDPAIVLPGTSLTSSMIDEMVRGTFTCSGQVCYSIKRIYVHEAQLDEFVEKYTRAAGKLTVGDGMRSQSDIGPVNNQVQYRKILALMALAETSGATVTQVGNVTIDENTKGGYFIRPTVVTGIQQDSPLVQEEQFGPIVPVLSYTTVDEAVGLANDTTYGLAASVWGSNVDEATGLAERIEAGSVFVNAHRIGCSPIELPFGGMKESGLGSRHGFAALEESSHLQIIASIEDHSVLPGPNVLS